MTMRVEDVDAVEQAGVPVLVQRYRVEGHVYEVFRKATESDDAAFKQRWEAVFAGFGGGELFGPWRLSPSLTGPRSFDPEEDVPEIVAVVYEDRGGLAGNERDEGDYLHVEYHPEEKGYCVTVPEESHPTVEGIMAPTLEEALERGILAWDKARREDEIRT